MTTLTPNKTFTIPSSSLTYAYIHLPPRDASDPTLLFLHGFPSTSYDWHHQVTYFSSLGYGILSPDLLGYGGTTKPEDVTAYLGRNMANDIIAILEHEKLENVIGIAHDWGTYLLSQLAIWFPSRFEKFVFISIPYTPPAIKFNLKKFNDDMEKKNGWTHWGYQEFLASDEAGKIIGEHWESFFSLVFCKDPASWTTSFSPRGMLRSSLESNAQHPIAPYIDAAYKAHHHAAFGNDYSAACKWYVRPNSDRVYEEEKAALAEGKIRLKLDRETLFVGGLNDAVCLAEDGKKLMHRLTEGNRLEVVNLKTGHWVMLERPDELNVALRRFIEKGKKQVRENL